MIALAGCIGSAALLLFGGLSMFTRPCRLRPELSRVRAQFGLRSLFLITLLCAGLSACLQSVHVSGDIIGLTLCWTICSLIGALEGSSWRGVGAWRGAAFAGSVGGAAGGGVFAAIVWALERPSPCCDGAVQPAWTDIGCLLIWGAFTGGIVGGGLAALRFLDRTALLEGLRARRDDWTGAAALCTAWRRGNRASCRGSWLVACAASMSVHFAVVHSPQIPWPGLLPYSGTVDTREELVLASVPVRPAERREAGIFLRVESEETVGDLPQETSTRPQPPSQESVARLLRAVRRQAGVDAPVCLDGYCPVALNQQSAWIKGSPDIATVYEGRTYHFPEETARQRFLLQPDSYAPVLSGYDPVVLVDEGRLENGRRESGLWYNTRVYLFSSESTLQQFRQSPDRYTAAAETSL